MENYSTESYENREGDSKVVTLALCDG